MQRIEIKAVTVFCSSSDAVAEEHFERAVELGTLIGDRGWSLVFGGASVGLMGALAKAAKKAGAYVIGVMPEFLVARGVAKENCDELVLTRDLTTRKATMAERGDAYIALPGSIGTLEELVEQMALKGLKQHTKPVILVNPDGYWDPFMDMLHKMVDQQFLKEEMLGLLTVVSDVDDISLALDSYVPPELPNKWFNADELT
jgi:uncharacterized protein (TIGR00730 family)